MSYTENFEKSHEFTARFEGGYSDYKEDSGGATNYGVSLKWLQDLGTMGDVRGDIDGDGDIDKDDVKLVTPEMAKSLFFEKFWQTANLDVFALHVAFMMYDMRVNHGPRGATYILQRGYNDMLQKSVLAVDGVFGPKTADALLQKSGRALIDALARQRASTYESIMARYPKNEIFRNGWLRRAKEMGEYATGLLT